MNFEKLNEQFAYFLKLRGLSMTRERKQILETVCNMKRHFTVDDLFFAMHAGKKKTSKATIYRTVELLVEGKILSESNLAGRTSSYELAEPGQHHGHMVCMHCEKVIEFKGPTVDKFIHEASVSRQFLPLQVTMKFQGFCSDCVKANPPSLRKQTCVPFLKYAQSRES